MFPHIHNCPKSKPDMTRWAARKCLVVAVGPVEDSSAMVKLAKAENGLFRPRAMTLANMVFRKLGRETS